MNPDFSNGEETPVLEFERLDVEMTPDGVLMAAMGRLSYVLIVGRTPDGDWYFASNDHNGGKAIMSMEKMKLFLLSEAVTNDFEEDSEDYERD